MNDHETIDAIVDLFHPKVVRAFAEGFTWKQVKEDLTDMMEEKVAERAALESPGNQRAAIRFFRRKVHPEVLRRLKASFGNDRN